MYLLKDKDMKKQIKDELKTKTKEELIKALKDVRKEISKLSLDISLQKEKNTALLKTKKKMVTRILTLINQPQVVEEKGVAQKALPGGK